ncbi:acyl-CoA thioesterase [Saccharopolyspora rhizosphaerae]|uniref:acyl-CoA thioesterase n=1 Tax=Saccharopolyspora rhizosphaerae TaxID=2492662 RepID=UPI001F29E066|nr:acyl-CoA thioesterase [Saccharopolyspora rhizosphaerae]
MTVRVYELDPQRHVNGAVYVQCSDHARFECLQAAGVDVDDMLADGIGPVNLETNLRYHDELRGGDDVDVTCAFRWGAVRARPTASSSSCGEPTVRSPPR